MAVVIEDIRIGDEFNIGKTDYLYNEIGEKVDIEIDFRVEENVISAVDNRLEANPTNSNLVIDKTRLLTVEGGQGFAKFNQGDQITISGTSNNDGNYVIVEKINQLNIILDQDLVSEIFIANSYAALSTPINGVTLLYNFIENSSPTTFNGLIDGEEQRLEIDDADATNQVTNKPMSFVGVKSYQIGGATIIGRGVVNDAQSFTIKHTAFQIPLTLFDQFTSTVALDKPDYYDLGACLKYIFRIDAARVLSDPNKIQSGLDDLKLGNSGWFNEVFNGGLSRYSFGNYSLERISDGSTPPRLEVDNIVEATFSIFNTDSTPFVDLNTKVRVGFNIMPEDEVYYQDTGLTFEQNFVFDRALATVGGGAVIGDLTGTDYQAITELEATFVSSSQIDIRVRFEFEVGSKARINLNTNKRYQFFIATQDHTLTRDNNDRATLLIDVNEFYQELADTNLISQTGVFIQHPYEDVADGTSTVETFPTDDVVRHSDFSIDFTDKEEDGILIQSVTNQIVLKHASEPEILLESDTQNTIGFPLEGGLVQAIDIETNRVFQIPLGTIRKQIQIKRNSANDSGFQKFFFSSYPYMVRWEYWKKINPITYLPDGIYDPTEPNDGLNHDWYRYTTIAGWTINHRLKFNIVQNGVTFTQEFDTEFSINDFESNSEWGNRTRKAFDNVTNDELLNGPTQYVLGYNNTRIEFEWEKVAGGTPLLDDVEIVFWIEVFESGGISGIRVASSVYEIGDESWFKSVDASNKVLVTQDGDKFKGTVLIDKDKLPPAAKFCVYGRIYDKTIADCPPDGLAMESGDCWLAEDGQNLIIE